jgi:rhamnogalacturonyl hydrolase YesR
MMKPYRKVLGLLLAAGMIVLALPLRAQKQPKEFTKWPAGRSPQEIGKRVAERLIAIPHSNFGQPGPPPFITYPEVATWYGALTFAQLSGDKDLDARLIKRFDPLFGEESNLIPIPDHVDRSVFGAVPLEIYIQTREQKYLDLGKNSADRQWEDPTPDGLSPQTRLWIDDMYMIVILQLQAYRATGDSKYLDRAGLEMTTYLDKLQQPNGLFYHAPDVPFYWGRGDGWVAAGMAEMLRSLPENHPRRAPIMESYRRMMKSLLQYQGKDGVWRQLIDHPDSWPETSSTGMFTFAMITGVKNGWLDKKTYGKAAREGWLGMISYLEPNGDLRNVCQGTGKKNDLQYYLDRERLTGDLHGQAPILWCASAFLR